MRTEDQDHVVARIAVDTGFPPEVVRESYLAALAELSVDARVHVYLPLFAAKRTIARLRTAKSESTARTRAPDQDNTARDGFPSARLAFAPKLRDSAAATPSAQPATVVGLA